MPESLADRPPEELAKRLALALAASDLGDWMWNRATDETVLSARACEIMGYPPGTRPKREESLELLGAEDQERSRRAVEGALASHGGYELEYLLHRRDGTRRWVVSKGQCLVNVRGEVTGMVGVLQDITARKEQEEALREAHRQLEEKTRIYDTALSVTDDFSYCFDLQARFTFANRALLDLWGKTLEEVEGKTCLELGYPDWHAAMHEREVAQVIATRRPCKGEVPYTSPTGVFGVYEYIVKPVFEASGSVSAVAGTTRDVTDRKRVEAVVERQHQVLLLLAEERPLENILTKLLELVEEQAEGEMHASILLLSEDGTRLLHGAAPTLPAAYNEAVSGMAIGPEVGSCGSAAWFGKPVYVSDIGRDPLWADYRGLAEAHGLRACWSCPILSKAEKVLGTFAMYYREPREPKDADRRIIETATRTAAIAIERKTAEQALRLSRDEAEAANRAKDRFLAVLSHELRTPLTPVLMAVSSHQLDPNLPPDLRDDLAMIRRNLDLEITLIDDMLDLSRIMSGKLRLRLEILAVNPLVSEACAICRPQIAEKALHLECNLAPALSSIRADAARLQQVLWNVLKNAAKFTPEGGRIRVITSAEAGRVEIRVEDSGMGMEREALPKIFEAFEQGRSKAGGLGLGLAISKALIELHGGTIRAESAGVGRGSAFIITLPAVEALPRESVPIVAQTKPKASAARLLVVEDHADTALLLCRLLEMFGYSVRHAATLAEARALAASESFDVLLSDVGLPDGTGYDLMAGLRESGLIGIAMSGYGMDEDIRRSREAGFAEHLVKPVDITVLQQTLQRLLQARE
ncbi:hypothetical protein BH09VER1_BH09VER1_42680 [soil metagenome]